jgi:hypothetical protein
MPSETVEVCADRLENVLAQSEYVKCQTKLIHGFFWNLLALCYLYILAVYIKKYGKNDRCYNWSEESGR